MAEASDEVREMTRVAVVGAKGCGKTTFIRSFHHGHRDEPASSHFGCERYKCRFETNKKLRKALILEMTALDILPLESKIFFYQQAHVIVIVYAIDNPKTYQEVRTRWLPEILPAIDETPTPIVFVGTKKDRRDDPQVLQLLAKEDLRPVTTEQGLELIIEVPGVSISVECSAFAISEVENIFMTMLN